MPLYLEKIPAVAKSFLEAEDVWEALFAIQLNVAGYPVTPRIAWKQACLHLRPLLPIEHQGVLNVNPRASWETISAAYGELFGLSKGDDIDLINVARAVRILHRHTTDPPRDVAKPSLVEVMHFFLMCDYIKLPLGRLYGGEDWSGAGLFRFCKYCWRTAIPGRVICYDHASLVVDGKEKVSGALDPEAKNACLSAQAGQSTEGKV